MTIDLAQIPSCHSKGKARRISRVCEIWHSPEILRYVQDDSLDFIE